MDTRLAVAFKRSHFGKFNYNPQGFTFRFVKLGDTPFNTFQVLWKACYSNLNGGLQRKSHMARLHVYPGFILICVFKKMLQRQ